jgi:ribulose-phosphate 3-epimerase
MSSIQMCPSILNADRNNLVHEISRISKDADWLHLDVMDSIFVPAFTFTFEECATIISGSPLPVDTHLMISNPDEVAAQFAEFGSKSVTFHLEASANPKQTLQEVRKAGARSGVAIKPATPVADLFELMDYADTFLIMTVEPGAGGQSFIHDMMPKVKGLRNLITQNNGLQWIQVDGGITLDTILEARLAGANAFVAGSAIFRADDPGEMVRSLRERVLSA